jgi:pimeloyl-ACP methyl ester carboxylesterase
MCGGSRGLYSQGFRKFGAHPVGRPGCALYSGGSELTGRVGAVLLGPRSGHDGCLMTPTLVYLHGIGSEHDDAWRDVVSAALAEVGYPGLLDGVDCRSPKYPNTLRYPSDENHVLPPQMSSHVSRSERDELRWRVERATADLERALGTHAAGWTMPLAAETVPAVMKVIPQARRYLEDEATRANTLHRVLAALPESGPIVLMAHSLGTVIAADLLTRLPAGIEVTGVITMGSPAGHLAVHRRSDRLEVLREPLPQVAWWLNVWGGADPVTGLRGISHRFPWVLDIMLPGVRHPMENYLGSATVATAVGRALFGSWDRGLSLVESLPEPEIDDVELNGYLLLTYAHFIAEHLPNKQQARFRGALEVVRADLTARLELTDTGEPPDPARLRTLSKSTALMPLLGVAMTNPAAPYDNAISTAARRAALHDLAVWIGLYSGYGRTLQRALTRASMAISPTWVDRMWLRPRRSRPPEGLDAVELTAIRLVAAELARQREGLDSDPQIYGALAHAESELLRDRARLSPYSDPRGPTIRLLDRQLRTLTRAIRTLDRQGLGPD